MPAIPLVASRILPAIPLVASRMHGQGGFSLSVRSLSRSSCRASTVLSTALALPSLCSLTLPESQSQPQFQHLAVLLLFMFDGTVQVPYCFEAASCSAAYCCTHLPPAGSAPGASPPRHSVPSDTYRVSCGEYLAAFLQVVSRHSDLSHGRPRYEPIPHLCLHPAPL
jgi:hypothetical protein